MNTLEVTKTYLTYPIEFVEIEEGILFEDDQFLVTARKLEHVIPCYGFRIEQKPLPGELLVEKARDLGVPKGPLLGKLKKGNDVTLEDGTIVYSKDVTSTPKKGFVLTILGDTKYCHNAKQLSEGADIVVHEATFNHDTTHLAASYGHSTNIDAAQIAKEAGATYLILNHISARFMGKDLQQLQQEASERFPNVTIANDFSQYRWQQGKLIEEKEEEIF